MVTGGGLTDKTSLEAAYQSTISLLSRIFPCCCFSEVIVGEDLHI